LKINRKVRRLLWKSSWKIDREDYEGNTRKEQRENWRKSWKENIF